MSTPSFAQLGVQPWLIKQCGAMQISSPTEVQQQCIPAVLGGKNVLGGAITGSGKTAAFALPLLQQLCEEVYGVFALILTPSRELAYQINDQFVALGAPMNVRTLVCIGGMDHGAQLEVFKQRPHIVIATPGRLKMLLSNFPEVTVTLKHLRYLVLDEADRLTEQGADLTKTTLECTELLGKPKSNRRTLLFTATINNRLTKVSDGLLPLLGVHDEATLQLCLTTVAASSTTEHNKQEGDDAEDEEGQRGQEAGIFHIPEKLKSTYLFLPLFVKMSYLVTLLRSRMGKDKNAEEDAPKKKGSVKKLEARKESVIIFVNSCARCEIVRLSLQMLGFPVSSLNSLLTQQQRLNNLSMFKAGITKYLVATDIAARGLDIPDVDLVVHYDFPKMSATYVHRVGRTARAGKEGESCALVTEADIYLLHKVERRTKQKLLEYTHTQMNDHEVCKVLDEVSVAKVDATLNVEATSGEKVQRLKQVGAERRTEINRRIRNDGLPQMRQEGSTVATRSAGVKRRRSTWDEEEAASPSEARPTKRQRREAQQA